MIHFTKETCGDLDSALRKEWLETNGLGGFASSTIVGLNTRRYHGVAGRCHKAAGRARCPAFQAGRDTLYRRASV